MPEKKKIYYTVREAAELLCCSHSTIREEIKKGKIKAKRVGHNWKIEAKSILPKE